MTDRTRILFVDDEPALLSALANVLRRDRHRWDLVFANGGAEALRELDKRAFDIVITDMRMPDVDGLAVLEAVKERSPRTIRIILSGYAESEVVLQALPLVHQFLSKPCDARTLRGVIERCNGDSRLPLDRTLTGLIGSLPCLPSEPRVLSELRHAAADPNVMIDTLITICERDPALAAKVLQIANTAHFRGDNEPTSSIKIAVATLGVDVMASLAKSTMVVDPQEPVCQAMIGPYQQQAVEAARTARRSAPDPAHADEAYAAGLLHDIGRLVLAHELGPRYLPAIEQAQRTGKPLWECELELLGVTHSAVGSHLLGMWALPTELIEACERHHDPRARTTPGNAVVAATQLAAGAR